LSFGDAATSFFFIKAKFVIADITARGDAAAVSLNWTIRHLRLSRQPIHHIGP
jgi:hypothetical protein